MSGLAVHRVKNRKNKVCFNAADQVLSIETASLLITGLICDKWADQWSVYLHSGLDDVQRRVSKHTRRSCNRSERSCDDGVDGFVGIVTYNTSKKQLMWTDETLSAIRGQCSSHSVLYLVWYCWCTNTHSPLYQFLREVMMKKRIAWLDPCLRTVAVRPWYVPLIPERHIQSITYCKHGKHNYIHPNICTIIVWWCLNHFFASWYFSLQ